VVVDDSGFSSPVSGIGTNLEIRHSSIPSEEMTSQESERVRNRPQLFRMSLKDMVDLRQWSNVVNRYVLNCKFRSVAGNQHVVSIRTNDNRKENASVDV